MFPTPDLSHLKRSDYSKIYEPDSDSFLFLDALECELNIIRSLDPLIIVEFGCGSGIISTFLSKHILSSHCSLFYLTDINPHACSSTQKTYQQNNVIQQFQITNCDLATPFLQRLANGVDLILFNPPYVPTDEVVNSGDNLIDAAYSGGKQGIEVIQRAIEQASILLTENGLFYMIALELNSVETLTLIAKKFNLTMEIVLKRRTLIESLIVVKFKRKLNSAQE
ncbi:unnamed protein product [Didymodactylos carnosus]|uniref:Methyltransferase HEMK2 n=1 Tax=Didymodactylos carnosus TaxID=1234261 RepID=A0A813W185_9BILA|nr:unnamed protein product [Didymodactylos carnosus]CAF0901016.1 unnamed protein product [Didymodactylos carnosus]CAF3636130.1 unnamed protein product [Didymodactylos carnosus]CAF3681654.1 unnamed protein product [Didymodactylos carnosus]